MAQKLVALGELLFNARTKADLTARQVAEAADISPAYLRTIETGRNPKTKKPSKPRAEVLAKIAAKLNLDRKELLELADYNPNLFEGKAAVAIEHSAEQQLRAMIDDSKNLGGLHPFLRERTLDRLNEFAADFKAMSSGIYRASPDHEPHMMRNALESCQQTMRSVSFRNDAWGTSRRGRRYLDAHQLLVERGVEMTRIFVVDERTEEQLQPTLERHQELGIKYCLVHIEDLEDRYASDFVIYDDSLLRTTVNLVGRSGKTQSAEYTQDPAQVQQAIVDFESLARLAYES